jgi:hypothetical protein
VTDHHQTTEGNLKKLTKIDHFHTIFIAVAFTSKNLTRQTEGPEAGSTYMLMTIV